MLPFASQFAAQKIDWEHTIGKEVDNTKVLTLLTKRPEGILALLNNECKFPKVRSK